MEPLMSLSDLQRLKYLDHPQQQSECGGTMSSQGRCQGPRIEMKQQMGDGLNRVAPTIYIYSTAHLITDHRVSHSSPYRGDDVVYYGLRITDYWDKSDD